LEDTTNGILAAKRAGMYCLAFHNPHSGEQDLSLADRVVEKIAEIEVEELLSLPLGEGC
jgi:beta-phosphoglucomutase-like phosphatase (HAD superfamily)